MTTDKPKPTVEDLLKKFVVERDQSIKDALIVQAVRTVAGDLADHESYCEQRKSKVKKR